MAKLEGQIDIKQSEKSKKDLERALKRLQQIEDKIDTVSKAKLSPQYRERRLNALNRDLELARTNIKKIQGQKLDIQIDKEGLLEKGWRNLRGVGNAMAVITGGVIVQGLSAVSSGINNIASSATDMRKLTVGMEDAVKAAGVMNRGVNASVDGIIEGLDRVSKGMIKPLEAQEFFNLSLQLGLVKTQEQFEKLTQNALILGQKTGLSVRESLAFITEGVAKGSPEILNNAGIVFTAAEAYGIYSRQIGKSADKLTDSERQMAKQQLAMQRLNEAVAEYGGEAALVVDGNERLAASIERAKIALGNLIALPASDFLVGLAERIDTVSGLTDVWADNFARLNDVRTAMAGTDLGLEGVSGGVQKTVLEADLSAIDEEIAKTKQRIELAKELNDQRFIADASQTLLELESERLEIAKELASLTPPDQISPNVNQGIAQALELQKKQQAAEQAITKETSERIALLKTLQALQKQGFLSAESYSEQLLNKEQSVADLRLFTEQAVRNAQVQTHANKINQLNEVAAKTQEVAQLEATIEAKKIEAVASFEKRRNQFYANEAKRIAEARQQGLAGLAGGLVSDVTGELGGLFGGKEENISRDIAENARRLAAVAAGDLSGESAQLLKESGFWEKMFGTETDPSIIQAKAQEIGKSLVSGFDQFGLIDTETAADKIVNMITGTGAGEGASIQDAIMAELETRGLSPELLDKAFNITRQEFGEELDISLVGENERQRITELNEEIKKLGDDGQIALDKLGDATGDIEKQSEVWDFALDEKIARYERILELMGMIAGTDPGVFGMGATEGPPPPPQAGGTSPVSPDTSFTIPTAPLPTTDFATPEIATSNATPQNQPQAQAGGQVMRGNINATIMMDGQAVANQIIPYVARAIR